MKRRAVWMLAVSCVLAVLGASCTAPEPESEPLAAESAGSEEEADLSKPKLVIEDQHSAVWMVVDNAFTDDEDKADDWTKWSGILIQLGTFWKYKETDGTPKPETSQMENLYFFEEMIIEGGGGSVTLTPKDFTWVNIVAERDVPHPPLVDPTDSEYFYPAPWQEDEKRGCVGVDPCPDRTWPPPEGWDCDHDIETVPSACLRMRSLHAYFRPDRIVTYWMGDDGYKLNTKHRTKDIPHDEFVFTLKDKVTVTVWNQRALAAKNAEVAALGKIKKITIKHPGDVNHGEIHRPPMDDYPPVAGGG